MFPLLVLTCLVFSCLGYPNSQLLTVSKALHTHRSSPQSGHHALSRSSKYKKRFYMDISGGSTTGATVVDGKSSPSSLSISSLPSSSSPTALKFSSSSTSFSSPTFSSTSSLSPTSFSSPSSDITPNRSLTEYDLSPQQFIYVVLTSIFITCLIVSDVIGVKLFEIPLPFEIFGHKTVEHTCGMLTFPVTFILGDIINEYYGPKAAKNTVYIGLAMSILVFTVMNIAQFMPYLDKPFNVSKENFDAIFGSAKLMYIASVFAYLVGSLSDIYIFGVIKRVTKGKLLWLRATGSTVISQIIDSFLVSYIAFSLGKTLNGLPAASMTEVFNIAATGYGLKFFLAASLTPLLYVLKSILTDKYNLQPLPPDSLSANEDINN